jgi:hypothetical protein
LEINMSEYTLKFDGYNIKLYQGENYINSWSAVSGSVGSQSPSLANVRNTGPIPEGAWSFNMAGVQTITGFDNAIGTVTGLVGVKAGTWPGGVTAWGLERVFLSPEDVTNTYGRDGFSIHGGDKYGSAGCIDLGHNEVAFFKELAGRGITNIKLDVAYDRRLYDEPHPLAGKFNWTDETRARDAFGRPLDHNGNAIALSQSPCFPAGTPILLSDGTEKPIEDIRPGDQVLAFDDAAEPGRGALQPREVVRLFGGITQDWIRIDFPISKRAARIERATLPNSLREAKRPPILPHHAATALSFKNQSRTRFAAGDKGAPLGVTR